MKNWLRPPFLPILGPISSYRHQYADAAFALETGRKELLVDASA
jgi:hypothetical protein